MTEVNVWLVNFTVRPDLPFPDETHRCFDKPIVARLPCIELKCGVNIGVLYDTNKLERDVRSLRNYAKKGNHFIDLRAIDDTRKQRE